MVMTPGKGNSAWREHQILLQEYGRVQTRCSKMLAEQAARIAALESEVIRLRGEAMLRITALAWEREDHARMIAAYPDLPRRFALARHVDRLAERIQGLLRERNAMHWWRMPGVVRRETALAGAGKAVAPTISAAAGKSVLCIGKDSVAAGEARAAVETAGGRFLQHDGQEDAVLEASLVAADLVICQTGCVSHNAFWRVRDHCRRTGKQCVLVNQPDALDAVRPKRVSAADTDIGS
jgi:hypothetical protein